MLSLHDPGEFKRGIVVFVQKPPSDRTHLQPDRRQRNCSGISVEELRSDNLFDCLDSTTERRLGHAKDIGRLCEALQVNQA